MHQRAQKPAWILIQDFRLTAKFNWYDLAHSDSHHETKFTQTHTTRLSSLRLTPRD